MQVGDRVFLKYFGPAALMRLYPHRDTKEMVWEVKADSGEQLHLSPRYIETLGRAADGV